MQSKLCGCEAYLLPSLFHPTPDRQKCPMATVQYRMDRHRAFMFLCVLVICVAGQLTNEAIGELASSKKNRSAVNQFREENLIDLRRNDIHRARPLERICVFQFLRESRFRHHLRQQDVHSP